MRLLHLATLIPFCTLSIGMRSIGMLSMSMLSISTLSISAYAAGPQPEIQRQPFPAQAPGKVHTIRIIPEVCAYLQGSFSAERSANTAVNAAADRAMPYRYGAARTGKRCQPRARLVDPAKANPSIEAGWILNDLIRIPNAACPAQQAVLRVWRKPANNVPQLDGEGRPRIYLEDAKRQAAAGKIAPLPQYAAVLEMEGRSCP
jgi:hypothetical protein